MLHGGRKRNCALHGVKRKEIVVVEVGEKKLLRGGRKRNCCTEAREKKLLLWR